LKKQKRTAFSFEKLEIFVYNLIFIYDIFQLFYFG